jgi:type I restriction enzyme S subunit
VSENKGLPKGWVLTIVGEVVNSIQYGHTASAIDRADGPRFLRITDIQNGLVEWSSVPSCEISKADLPKYRLENGDIVFARTGATTGKSYLIRHCPEAIFASYLFRLRMASEANPSYLHAYFQTADYWRQIEEGKRGIGQPNVNAKTLAQIEFPLAPLPEQHRIVAEIETQFTRLDVSVAALKRVQANLRRYRASVLQAACEGRLVPTEAELAHAEGRSYESTDQLLQRILHERRARWETEQIADMKAKGKVPKDDRWKSKYKEPVKPDTSTLPELPEGWGWATIEQLTNAKDGMTTGPFGTLLGKADQCLTGVPVVGIPNITESGFVQGNWFHITSEKAEALQKYYLRPGDLVVSRSGTVGEICLVPAILTKSVMSTNLMRLRVVASSDIATWLVVNFKGNPTIRLQLEELCKGSTRLFLNLDILSRLLVRILPASERERILGEVERRLSVIDELEATIAANLKRADRLRQSILKRAFEGKLVPQDPTDEPASVLLERIRAEREYKIVQPKATQQKTNVVWCTV